MLRRDCLGTNQVRLNGGTLQATVPLTVTNLWSIGGNATISASRWNCPASSPSSDLDEDPDGDEHYHHQRLN